MITHPGKYRINVAGYSSSENKTYNMTASFEHPGSGIMFCTLKMNDKTANFFHQK